MAECSLCGTQDSVFSCHECGASYCSKHRSPRAHHCPNIHSNRDIEYVDIAPPRTVTNVYTQVWSYLVAVLFYVAGALLELVRLVWAGRYAISAAVFGLLLIGATVGTGYQPVDSLADNTIQNAADAGSDLGNSLNNSHNKTEVQMHFLALLNEERQQRGLQTLSRDSQLRKMGYNHSRDMAQKDYFDHMEPDGDTVKMRYMDNGLLPECNLQAGGRSYYAGAENIYYVSEFGDEKELAKSIFQSWMNSEGHRRVMLLNSATEAGLGIYITDDGGAYASLELC